MPLGWRNPSRSKKAKEKKRSRTKARDIEKGVCVLAWNGRKGEGREDEIGRGAGRGSRQGWEEINIC